MKKPVKNENSHAPDRRLKKVTEKGRQKEMNTMAAFRKAYPTSEAVLQKVFDYRVQNAGGLDFRCECGKRVIDSYRKMPFKMGYSCRICNRKVYPLVNTPFERPHRPLHETLELVFRMIQTKHGLTAKEVERDYGLQYDSALNVLHRIRNWMGNWMMNAPFQKDSYVEIDEVYIKYPTGLGKNFKWSKGLGSERLTTVITMVERGGIAKGFVLDGVNNFTVRNLIKEQLDKGNFISTDESKLYRYLEDAGYNHISCNHSKKEWVNEAAHTNHCEGFHSFLQGNISNTYKGVGKTQLYVSETAFRFSWRNITGQEAINKLFETLPPLVIKNVETQLIAA